MKWFLWLVFVLTCPIQAQSGWMQFSTDPPGAEVYLEGSGGLRYLGLSGKSLPVEAPRARDTQGRSVQLLPGRVRFRKAGHQELTVTISASDWESTRLPQLGQYRLVPNNFFVQLQDWWQAYPLVFVALTLAFGAALRWRWQLAKTTRENEMLARRQKPGDDPLFGTEIGGYRLTQRLGQGGMATVYRASAGGSEYALKLLIADGTESDNALRFRRECRLAARLKHPTLVRVVEYGEQENLLFLVMELIAGKSLPLAPGGAPWSEVWPWYKELLLGIQYAHGQGVVHRDLKPQNILMTPQGKLKVVDFGLARTQEMTAITETGKALGTPSYLAPEQLTGGGSLVEPRTDQYALGILLFQALTGFAPFRGSDASEVAHQHLTTLPPLLREFRPDLPENLESIVNRMLQKNPQARYADLGQVLEALSKVGLGRDSATVSRFPAVKPLEIHEQDTREL